MKKSRFLLAVIVFVVIVCAGIPYVVGNKAKSYYLNLLEDSSQFGFVTFTNTSYERGFLKSKAVTLMQINFPAFDPLAEPQQSKGGASADGPVVEMTEQTFQLEFEHIFYHGPLPVSSGSASRFGFGPAVALVETTLTRFSPNQQALENILEEIPGIKNTISISRIGFDGTTDSIFEIPEFEYSLKDGNLSFEGLKSEMAYSLVSGAVSGTYDMKNLEFSMFEGGSMAWRGFAGEFDLKKVLPMFYVGPSKAVFGAMEMNVPSVDTGEMESFKLEEMEMTANSSYDGQMVHFKQSTIFGGITIEGEKYGPLLINAEVKNLDAQVLNTFQQKVFSTYKNASSLDPDAIAGTIIPMYLDMVGQLLAGDPELNIHKFSLVTPKGDAEGSFNLKFIGIEEVSFDDPMKMMQYIKNIESSANLTIDEELVRIIMLEKAKSSAQEQAVVSQLLEQGLELSDEQIEAMAERQYEQQLEMLLIQNFIVREGEKLKTSLTFKQGELLVNGLVLPILGVN